MANIKPHKFFLILVFVLLNSSACAQILHSYSHLGNSGKKFTAATDMSSNDWNDAEELERVWQASFVRIPNGKDNYIHTTIAELSSIALQDDKKSPTVVYLHGCSGFWAGTIRRINSLAENGFAVILLLALHAKIS